MSERVRATIAAALALAAAAGVAWRLRLQRRAATSSGPSTEWTCDCGQRFRISGTGRHRIYWLADAAPADPVVGVRCPSCDRALPERDPVVAAATG